MTLSDARGLQEPPGRGADHPRRQDGRALRPHGPRGRLRHDPEVRLRRLPARGRGRGAVHEHGLPGARHGLRRGVRPDGGQGGRRGPRQGRRLRGGPVPVQGDDGGLLRHPGPAHVLQVASRHGGVGLHVHRLPVDGQGGLQRHVQRRRRPPQKPLAKRMAPIIRKRGLLKLAGEVRKAVRAL